MQTEVVGPKQNWAGGLGLGGPDLASVESLSRVALTPCLLSFPAGHHLRHCSHCAVPLPPQHPPGMWLLLGGAVGVAQGQQLPPRASPAWRGQG